MYSPNRITAGLAVVTVAFALGACDDNSPSSPSSPASVSSPTTVEPQFANNSQQNGLVNVSTGDIDLLNNVNLAVAANVIATVCDVDVVLAVSRGAGVRRRQRDVLRGYCRRGHNHAGYAR